MIHKLDSSQSTWCDLEARALESICASFKT